eukprot:gene4465-14620_t
MAHGEGIRLSPNVDSDHAAELVTAAAPHATNERKSAWLAAQDQVADHLPQF